MKVGLFIIDNSFVREQIVEFYSYYSNSEISYIDLYVFEKKAKPRAKGVKHNVFTKIFRSVLTGSIFNSIINRVTNYWSRGNNRGLHEYDINLYKIDSINSNYTRDLLSEIELDYGVFILFDEIVREDTLKLIQKPLNIHNAHLPDYRGCQPMYWLLKNKEKFTSVTLHKMTKGIDEGDIIFEMPIKLDLKKDVTFNTNNSIKVIALLLLFGLRRLMLFNPNFGIPQVKERGCTNYFKRPQC